MNKFKVGDPVKIRKGITNEDMGTNYPRLDLDKVYHISAVEGTWYHLKETHPGYCFCTDWLEPAPVTPPVDEPKEKAKAKYKVGEKGLGIDRVLFNKPATIVFWADGTKTVVKCRKGDKWDAEKGLAMACAKKLLGNENGYHKEIAKYAKTANKDESVLMDTEKLRNFVLKTCLSFVGCTDCPCHISNGGRCFIIATADREQLSMMYRQFLYSGKLRKEENNA